MKTIKLYDNNAYETEFLATVLSCNKTENGYDVVLDKTCFFPEEGGQASDSGVIGDAKVTHVRIEGDVITHTTDKAVSDKVACKINWDERYDKMQQHTGEHIVSGIVNKMYGYNNVGFHLGSDDVTFDFDGPLTRDQLNQIELIANDVIYKNVSVKGYYPTDPSALEYRSKTDIEGAVRIVEIEGVDLCACCAPHVKTTGEVGIIKLLEAGSYKGGVRVHLACGKRAVADYQTKFQNLETIATALSSGKNNAAEYFTKYQQDVADLKAQLSKTKAELLTLKAMTVTAIDGNIVLFEDGLEGGDLRNFVNALSDKYTGICAVFSEKNQGGYNFVIAAKNDKLNDICNGLRKQLGAKCGGNDKMIQGSVSAHKEDITKIVG